LTRELTVTYTSSFSKDIVAVYVQDSKQQKQTFQRMKYLELFFSGMCSTWDAKRKKVVTREEAGGVCRERLNNNSSFAPASLVWGS
jgi:hypothetical protein